MKNLHAFVTEIDVEIPLLNHDLVRNVHYAPMLGDSKLKWFAIALQQGIL